MRAPLLFLSVTLLLGGAYTAFWFKKADELKQMVEESASQLNEEAKGLNQGSPLIRYDEIRTSGFPFAMTVEIVKPVVDVPVSALLGRLRTAPLSAPLPGQPQEWMEEISYSDGVRITSNLLGDRFMLIAAGDRTHVSFIDHKPHHTLKFSAGTPLTCHLAIARELSDLWTMPRINSWADLAPLLRGAGCGVDGLVLSNVEGGGTLLSADRMAISASNEPDGTTNRTIAFLLDIKSEKTTPAIDAITAEYTTLTNTFLGIPQSPPVMLSTYGEQNAAVDIRYNGPMEKKDFMDPAMHMKLDINQLDFSSAVTEGKTQAHIAAASEGDEHTASAVIHSHFTVSEAYDSMIRQRVESAYAQAASAPAAKDAKSPLPSQEMVVGLLPNLHALGRIAFDVDARAKGTLPQSKGSVSVSAFDLTAAPYGIKLKGEAMSEPKKMPAGELDITCVSCDALASDAAGYYLRIKALADHAKQPYPPAALSDGVRHFLHAVSENGSDPKALDLMLRLKSKDTGEMTLSGKQIMEVLALYTSDIAANIPKPPASAASPAAGGK
jgi:hypothetical protein